MCTFNPSRPPLYDNVKNTYDKTYAPWQGNLYDKGI